MGILMISVASDLSMRAKDRDSRDSAVTLAVTCVHCNERLIVDAATLEQAALQISHRFGQHLGERHPEVMDAED